MSGNITRDSLVALFIDTANNVDKSIDFDLHYWLSLYEPYIREPNFAEASMVIISAAIIYIRKVDYFEEIVMHMNAEQIKNKYISGERNGTEEPQPKKRRLARRFVPKDTLAETLDFLEKELVLPKCVPASRVTEKLMEKLQVRSNYEKLKEMFQIFKAAPTKANKNKVKMPKILESNTNVSSIGKSFPIIDIEFDETIGLRRDYKAFSDLISLERSELLVDHNYNEYFKHVDLVDEHYEREALRLRSLDLPLTNVPTAMAIKRKRRNSLFKLFMPNTYLKETYDIDLDQSFDDDILLNQHVTDFNTLRQAQEKELDLMAHNTNRTTNELSINIDTESNIIDALPTPPLVEEEVLPLEAIESKEPDIQKLFPNIRISVDEGVCFNLSELHPEDWAKLNPRVNLTDIMSPKKDEKVNIKFDPSNLLGIDNQYLTYQEDFLLPLEYIVKKPKLKLNIFKLPENKLRREVQFLLPKEYSEMKKNLSKKTAPQIVDTQPRIFKFDNSFRINFDMETPPTSPQPDNDEKFFGFDNSNVFSSSVLIDKIVQEAEDEAMNIMGKIQNRKLSRDSGIISPEQVASPIESDNLSQEKSGMNNSGTESGYETSIFSESNMESTVPNDSKALYSDNSDSGNGSSIVSESGTLNRTDCSTDNNEIDCSRLNEKDEDNIQLSEQDEELSKNLLQKLAHQVDEMQALVTKVKNWHQYLKPILKESEARNHFDIHEYGTEIIDSFPSSSKTSQTNRPKTTLGNILDGKERYSTARYFLSMLQLANTNNVHINVQNKDPKKLSDIHEIELELLSRTRHHELMEEEVCPSSSRSNAGGNGNGGSNKRINNDEMSTSTPILAKRFRMLLELSNPNRTRNSVVVDHTNDNNTTEDISFSQESGYSSGFSQNQSDLG